MIFPYDDDGQTFVSSIHDVLYVLIGIQKSRIVFNETGSLAL
jgi:hypothetical protein